MAPPPAAEVHVDPTMKKLPVGSTVSSVHVDYNYFEVGTGQVNKSAAETILGAKKRPTSAKN